MIRKTLLQINIEKLQRLVKTPPKEPVKLLLWSNELLQIIAKIYGGNWYTSQQPKEVKPMKKGINENFYPYRELKAITKKIVKR